MGRCCPTRHCLKSQCVAAHSSLSEIACEVGRASGPTDLQPGSTGGARLLHFVVNVGPGGPIYHANDLAIRPIAAAPNINHAESTRVKLMAANDTTAKASVIAPVIVSCASGTDA